MKNSRFALWVMLAFVMMTGCKDYLDLRPNKNLVIARELKDLRAILDNLNNMNFFITGIGESAADNFYLTDADWASLDEGMKNLYIWGDEILYDRPSDPWLDHYRSIYNANFVLETIDYIKKTIKHEAEWNDIKGAALFYRGHHFFTMVAAFAKAYDQNTSANDLGIPLRLTTDFTVPSVRASVEESYRQIISDLHMAADLLPVRTAHSVRPSKPAAYAMLSRVYLCMRKYELADEYARKCLELEDSLLDFNTLDTDAVYPIPAFNDEVLFAFGVGGMIPPSRMRIDSNLYQMYEEGDIRKLAFFRTMPDGSVTFKGTYNGAMSQFFSGLAVGEVQVTRAECLVRQGEYSDGIDILNVLLEKRYRAGEFVPRNATSQEEALEIVLLERRKELLMRDIRWIDIKRLNKEPGNEIWIKRQLNGELFELPPNDNRYALPIPATVIERTGMPQNPR